jgi:hypothetical protein
MPSRRRREAASSWTAGSGCSRLSPRGRKIATAGTNVTVAPSNVASYSSDTALQAVIGTDRVEAVKKLKRLEYVMHDGILLKSCSVCSEAISMYTTVLPSKNPYKP